MVIVFLIVALVISLTLHEFAHALVGDWLGDTTARMQGRLTLNPLAHIDPLMTLALPIFLILVGSPVIFGAARPVPFSPWAVRWGKWGSALLAAAGPLTNLLLAVVAGVWLRFFDLGGAGGTFLATFVVINLAFFIFNLIPFPPLDGSRVLYAMVPEPVREVMDRIERAGLVAVVLFLFILYPLILPWISRAAVALGYVITGRNLLL